MFAILGGFTASSRQSPTDLTVSPEDPVSRFLFNSKDFSVKKNTVRPSAFLPNADLKTSVFRVKTLSEDEIWAIGADIGQLRQKTLYGRADITASAVLDHGLKLDVDDIPAHHANIVGWPHDKSERMSIAQSLAAYAVLELR